MRYFCSMNSTLFVLLQTQAFETLPRTDRVDWIGLMLLLLGMILLMILQYRNPNAISSMVSRSFRETTKKLYFAAPAIDSIDKSLFFMIFFSGGALCVHYLLGVNQLGWAKLLLVYSIPLLFLLFLALPLRIVAFVAGYQKPTSKIIKRQLPVLFLMGIVLLPMGALLFLNLDFPQFIEVTIIATMIVLVIWLHVRVFRDLFLEQISIYYIFMYFCTLEILPMFVFWVWIWRT